MKKYFIITIDTEGDNIWKRVIRDRGLREVTVENSKYIERFQLLCDKYRFIPTYLVNYEMACSEYFVGQAKEWLKNKKCEIGMHMHAWNTPPILHLPFNNKGHNPFAGEYPKKILWEKMQIITELIEKNFGIRPISHRGGRWYIDGWYVEALFKLGYKIDCSITPGVSWENTIGNKMYGPNYNKYPTDAFILTKNKSNRKKKKITSNNMLEIPPTIITTSLKTKINKIKKNPEKITSVINEKIWLRPTGRNLEEMFYIIEKTKDRNYIEFMLHSSEFMPGGSPTFKTEKSIDKLFNDLEILFSKISESHVGVSLTDYRELIIGKSVDCYEVI